MWVVVQRLSAVPDHLLQVYRSGNVSFSQGVRLACRSNQAPVASEHIYPYICHIAITANTIGISSRQSQFDKLAEDNAYTHHYCFSPLPSLASSLPSLTSMVGSPYNLHQLQAKSICSSKRLVLSSCWMLWLLKSCLSASANPSSIFWICSSTNHSLASFMRLQMVWQLLSAEKSNILCTNSLFSKQLNLGSTSVHSASAAFKVLSSSLVMPLKSSQSRYFSELPGRLVIGLMIWTDWQQRARRTMSCRVRSKPQSQILRMNLPLTSWMCRAVIISPKNSLQLKIYWYSNYLSPMHSIPPSPVTSWHFFCTQLLKNQMFSRLRRSPVPVWPQLRLMLWPMAFISLNSCLPLGSLQSLALRVLLSILSVMALYESLGVESWLLCCLTLQSMRAWMKPPGPSATQPIDMGWLKQGLRTPVSSISQSLKQALLKMWDCSVMLQFMVLSCWQLMMDLPYWMGGSARLLWYLWISTNSLMLRYCLIWVPHRDSMGVILFLRSASLLVQQRLGWLYPLTRFTRRDPLHSWGAERRKALGGQTLTRFALGLNLELPLRWCWLGRLQLWLRSLRWWLDLLRSLWFDRERDLFSLCLLPERYLSYFIQINTSTSQPHKHATPSAHPTGTGRPLRPTARRLGVVRAGTAARVPAVRHQW